MTLLSLAFAALRKAGNSVLQQAGVRVFGEAQFAQADLLLRQLEAGAA